MAVLGTPIDQIYPAQHIPLAREIVSKGGAVMSEYAPKNTQRKAPFSPGEFIDKLTGERRQDPKSAFLHRNRLVAGLADIVVIVEGVEKVEILFFSESTGISVSTVTVGRKSGNVKIPEAGKPHV